MNFEEWNGSYGSSFSLDDDFSLFGSNSYQGCGVDYYERSKGVYTDNLKTIKSSMTNTPSTVKDISSRTGLSEKTVENTIGHACFLNQANDIKTIWPNERATYVINKN